MESILFIEKRILALVKNTSPWPHFIRKLTRPLSEIFRRMTREEDRISVFLEPSKSADFKIIQRFISKFTKSEEEEYLNPSCFTLKKPLEYDFCVRLIKDLATSDNDDRFEAISCTRYVGVLDFWHFGSFTANDEKIFLWL